MQETRIATMGEVCRSVSVTYRGEDSEVVLVNTSDVLEGKVLNHQPVANKGLKGQFKKTFQRNDILYSEIRPQNKRFAYIDFDQDNYIASTKLMVIRAYEEVIDPYYLYYYLKSDAVVEELQMLAETRSGTFPQITFSEVASLLIPLPPLDVQRKIVSVLRCIECAIDANSQINDNLAA